MVRNVASMTSLNNSMVDCSVSAPQQQQQQQQEQLHQGPLQRLNGHPMMQVCGSDAFTRMLMTRVAMGEATREEQAAFYKHVDQTRSHPSIQNLLQQSNEQQSSIPTSRETTSSPALSSASATLLPPQQLQHDDYQIKLMALEKQNKARLIQARREQDQRKQVNPESKITLEEAQDQSCRLKMLCAEDEKRAAQGDKAPDPNIAAKWQMLRENANNVFGRCPTLNLHPDFYLPCERTQFEKLWKYYLRHHAMWPVLPMTLDGSPVTDNHAQRFKPATRKMASQYTKPFCDFLAENPTVFHCVAAMKQEMLSAGWTQLSERDSWKLEPSGHYFVERNGSSLIAFVVGAKYEPGNGAAILAGHVDAITAKLKPISQIPNKAGYLQLGVAPYAGGLNSTWWDRDLGIGGRVHIKQGDKILTKLVKLDWPIAKIPTLAPHFGAAASGPFNAETQMVPIIGLDSTESSLISTDRFSEPPLLGGANGPMFIQTQPPALVKAIQTALGLGADTTDTIVNWELELYDVQKATVSGLNKEFITAGRIDDKLCSWAALKALLDSQVHDTAHSSLLKVVALFDDEEIGSQLRQGAKSNFLSTTMERAVGSLNKGKFESDLMGRTYANSFLVSSDVTHAVNPNFLNAYMENHAPHLNVGVAVAADPNGHMTTDSVSTTIFKRCADKVGAQLQVFQIRNDGRSGGTVGPMLSSALGVRAIDAGLPQLSMHSIRATCGALDPGLGVLMFLGFLNGFEEVDKEMQE